MLEAITTAKLGDDGWREDETVIKLEEVAAKKLGKETGLLVCSGTQGNLCAIMAHTVPGQEIICDADSHTVLYEVGGVSRIGGLMVRSIKTTDGFISPEDIQTAIRPTDIHQPMTSLLTFENTHNRHGGAVITIDQSRLMADIAHDNDLKVHLDGARIFNAAIALNEDPAKLVQPADSAQFCLSKGLSCPVGSIVVGTEEFIEQARRNRQLLGGRMRQAGIIAAPGLVALESMITRLEEDHQHAQLIVKTLKEFEGINIFPCRTNIIVFDLSGLNLTTDTVLAALREKGCLGSKFGPTLIRLTTHYGITMDDIKEVNEILRETFTVLTN